MTKKIVFGAALALVIVGIASTPASALCNPPKSLSTYNSGSGAYTYWQSGFPNAGTSLVADIWSAGGNHTGTCNTFPGILYFGAEEGQVGINLNLGDSCVVGCPSGSLSIQATALNGPNSHTLTSQVVETSLSAINFDFSGTPAHVMGNYPRQHVTTSSRAGSTVNVTFSFDAASANAFEGTAGQITGYNVRSAQSATDPGRNASAYPTVLTNIPAPGGIAATGSAGVVCQATATDQWVVTQLVTTGGGSSSVSQATRIKCDPTLANPKYNIIPKKSMGTSTQH
jgi:hypothetical protein